MSPVPHLLTLHLPDAIFLLQGCWSVLSEAGLVASRSFYLALKISPEGLALSPGPTSDRNRVPKWEGLLQHPPPRTFGIVLPPHPLGQVVGLAFFRMEIMQTPWLI